MKNNYALDNKIIPLFNVPITMKNLFDIKTNKNIDNNNTSAYGNEEKKTNIKNISNLYSKALENYNINLNIENNNENLTKTNLIGEIKEENNIIKIYNNYLFLINKYLPYLVYYNSFIRLGLFLPNQIFKPQFYTNKYKKFYSPINTNPSFNLREILKKYKNKKNKNIKKRSPYGDRGLYLNSSLLTQYFIRKYSLKKIFSLNKASLIKFRLENINKKRILNNKIINKIFNNFFNLNTHPSHIGGINSLVLEKINSTNKINIIRGKKRKFLKINEKSNIIKKILIDNNFLPLNNLNPIIKRVEPSLALNNNRRINKTISIIWNSKDVKILLNNIVAKGDSLIHQLNGLILEKKTLINNNKINNLFFNYLNSQILENNRFTNVGNININNLNNYLYNSNPINLNYYLNNNTSSIVKRENDNSTYGNNPILNQYLKSMSVYNMKKKGILINYKNLVNYSFIKGSLGYANKLIFKVYKLLQASFKSMYCLISKPLFIITPDKIIIRLFYFLFVPNILKYKKLLATKNHSSSILNRRGKNSSYGRRKLFLAKKQYNKFRKLKKEVRIKLRKLSNLALTQVFSNKFKILSLILSKLFKKPVEFDLTRLHYAYNDSNILVNLLGIMINKIKLRIIVRRLFEKAVIKNLSKLPIAKSTQISKGSDAVFNSEVANTVKIPAFLSGIKIKVGGRLLTQSVVPRQTVKITQRGATQRGKINFLDVARYTRKNKRGAFSITIKSGQNIF